MIGLHRLSAFCPPASYLELSQVATAKTASLHCLSAFCPLASCGVIVDTGSQRCRSPLPFGVLPPGFLILNRETGEPMLKSPLPFGVLPPGFTRRQNQGHQTASDVSIAFRRSAPRLHARIYGSTFTVSDRLHCLSAFCPPASKPLPINRETIPKVSIAFRRSAPRLPNQESSSVNWRNRVSIAFRRSAPRLPNARKAKPISHNSVSIAFRRSAPRLRV